MGLVDTTHRDHPQTVAEMLRAADDRHLEAVVLHESDWPEGAIYLLGYVAEMHLKSAYARLVFGRRAVVAEWAEIVDQAKRDRCWAVLAASARDDGLHSLTLWKQLLLDARASDEALPSLADSARRELDDLVDWMDQNWCVDMRYAAGFASRTEAEMMLRHVERLAQLYWALVGE